MPSVLQRGLVVHPAGAECHVGQGAAPFVADLGELDGVLLLLAGYERPPPGPARLRAADLDLAAVGPEPDTAGGGVGEYVRQRVQPLAGRGGITPPGQQRADLAHGAGDRGPVHAIHHRQRGVRDLQPQHRQGHQHPVGECQVLAAPGARSPQPVPAAAGTQVRLPAGLPRAGQLSHDPAQVVTGDPGEGRMAQGRTSP